MLCVSVGLNWHRNVCPILDKIKGGKDSPYGALSGTVAKRCGYK